MKALIALIALLAASSAHAFATDLRDQQIALAVCAVLLGFVCSLWWRRGRR